MRTGICQLFVYLGMALLDNVIHSFIRSTSKIEEPFLTLKNEKHVYKFGKSLKQMPVLRIQYHLPYLIQKILQFKEPIIYNSNRIKYIIIPFQEVFMVELSSNKSLSSSDISEEQKKEKQISLGKYVDSFIKNEALYQLYQCGEVCDLKKGILRTSIVCFKGMIGKMRVENVVEKTLCSYVFTIGGEEITRVINKNIPIEFTAEDRPQEDTKSEQEKIHEDI